MPHIHEKIDFCAETFVVYNDTVLLRKHDKYKVWLGVGGHIELDEDPNQAAVREVKEEVGLDIVLYSDEGKLPPTRDTNISLIPPEYVNRHHISDTHEHVAFVYFATSHTNELDLSHEEITDECKWFTKKELLSDEYTLAPEIKYYALRALEKLARE